MKGIIYKYTSPSNKIYIGQTYNEPLRRRTFNNINLCYAGGKIDNARKKYGPENFTYEILEEIEENDIKNLVNKLNTLEIQYIKQYNSIEFGYNSNSGGNSYRLYNSKEIGKRISESKSKKVIQYDLEGNFMKVWDSSNQIYEELGILAAGIRNCCRNITTHAGCYIWRYLQEEVIFKIEGLSEAKQNQIYAQKQSSNTKNGKTYKKLLQYDYKGNFIREFESIKEACDLYNINRSCIIECCTKKLETAGGYIWRYYTSNYDSQINLSKEQIDNNYKNFIKFFSKIFQYDSDGNLIQIHDSFTKAEQSTNISRKKISKACKDGTLLNNYYWKYLCIQKNQQAVLETTLFRV